MPPTCGVLRVHFGLCGGVGQDGPHFPALVSSLENPFPGNGDGFG